MMVMAVIFGIAIANRNGRNIVCVLFNKLYQRLLLTFHCITSVYGCVQRIFSRRNFRLYSHLICVLDKVVHCFHIMTILAGATFTGIKLFGTSLFFHFFSSNYVALFISFVTTITRCHRASGAGGNTRVDARGARSDSNHFMFQIVAYNPNIVSFDQLLIVIQYCIQICLSIG